VVKQSAPTAEQRSKYHVPTAISPRVHEARDVQLMVSVRETDLIADISVK